MEDVSENQYGITIALRQNRKFHLTDWQHKASIFPQFGVQWYLKISVGNIQIRIEAFELFHQRHLQ